MTRPQQNAVTNWRGIASPVLEIIDLVAFRHGFTRAEILAYGRTKDLALVRQVAMYLACRHTSLKQAAIARRFRRDRVTVIHAVRRVEWRMRCDAEFAADIAILNNLFGGEGGR